MNKSALVVVVVGTILCAVSSKAFPQNEPAGFTPQPGTMFSSALSESTLAGELHLNVAPQGVVHHSGEFKSLKAGSASLFGSIRNTRGEDICGLVLANGQFTFSCSPNGTYSLSLTTDANNQIGLFGFADGHFPYHVTLGGTGGRYDIVLNVATTSVPPPPTPATNSTVTFTITDACHDGWAIDYKFYDEDHNLVWPTATTHYFTTFDDTPYSQALSCVTGALVCYGARNENPLNTGFWGVDVDNSKACSDCCIRCQQGAGLNRRLTC